MGREPAAMTDDGRLRLVVVVQSSRLEDTAVRLEKGGSLAGTPFELGIVAQLDIPHCAGPSRIVARPDVTV